jgi:selenocysteine lyase/cysteine desulfurase
VKGFSLSVGAPGAPFHAAAHSHHPWPDVTRPAQEAAWRDAARLLDRKWEHVFASVIPEAQRHVARVLGLPDPASIAFGPNTHSFLLRLLSCLPRDRAPR